MSIATDTASEFLMVAQRASERGDVREALYHIDKAQQLLLRPDIEVEAPGTAVGESIRYGHLGRVLAEKAKRRFA
jgi:HEPN domain-containing protein